MKHLARKIAIKPAVLDLMLCGWSESIAICRNLASLHVSDLPLTVDLLRAISGLLSLDTVTFVRITMSDEASDGIAAGSIAPSASLVNVTLLEPPRDPNVWYIVAMCPTIRALGTLGSAQEPVAFPPEVFQAYCNPFTTLERLSLHPVDNAAVDDLLEFVRWMRKAREARDAPHASASPFPLSHFLLGTRWRMSIDGEMALIDGLHGCHLRSLFLVGAETLRPDLLRWLAQALPDLRALSLVWRASDYHDDARLCTWPYPTWKYAKVLAGFRSLRHFAWNSRLGVEERDHFPADMVRMEDGYRPDSWMPPLGVEDSPGAQTHTDAAVARLFAVHCPTLTSFGLIEDAHSSHTWEISGAELGTPARTFTFRDEWSNEDYCPSAATRSWPRVRVGDHDG